MARRTASPLQQLPTACQVCTLVHSLLPPDMLWPMQGHGICRGATWCAVHSSLHAQLQPR